MPYSKTPSISTYETKRVSFLGNPENRGSGFNTDLRLSNMMIDIVESPGTGSKKAFIKSRPGLQWFNTKSAGEGRGIFYWQKGGILFHVIGSTVYVNTVADITLQTTTGMVGFAEHVNQSGVHTLCLSDGDNMYIYSTNGSMVPANPFVVQRNSAYTTGTFMRLGSPYASPYNQYKWKCTTSGTTAAVDPATWPNPPHVGDTVTDGTVVWTAYENAFPTPHVPNPIFLDGYMFLAKLNTQDVYNSDLNDPQQWSAGNFITAEMYADNVVALAKNNNMIYAVGTNSIQFLYDNANPSGTPLLNNPGAVLQFGTPAAPSVVMTEKEVVLVGDAGAGGYSVWKVDGFKATEIAIPAVCQSLNAESTALPYCTASCVRVMGQKLYVLRLQQTTWVYSFTTELWSQWAGFSGNFNGAWACPNTDGTNYWLAKTQGIVYKMSDSVYTDAVSSLQTTTYPCTLRSAKFDFDSLNRKTMSRFSIVGDVPSTVKAEQAITVQWSDDDYNTWSAARTLYLNGDLPSIRQLGDFRRRAFSITYNSGLPLRIEGMEVDINKHIK